MSRQLRHVEDEIIQHVVVELGRTPAAELPASPRWKAAAAAEAAAGSETHASRKRIGVVALTLAAAAGCVVAVAAIPGSSTVERADALPVFARPAVDATRVRSATPILAHHRARYRDARVIDTPKGPGYVMTASNGEICLAIPDDPGAGYGQSCATKAQIARRGLMVALVSTRGGEMVAIVPDKTSATIHEQDGSTKTLNVTDGVISAASTAKATVTYVIGGHVHRVALYDRGRCVVRPPGVSDQRMLEIEQAVALPQCTDIPRHRNRRK
jgi:hypothetical protein